MVSKQHVINAIKFGGWTEHSRSKNDYAQIMFSVQRFFRSAGKKIDQQFLAGIIDDYVWGF